MLSLTDLGIWNGAKDVLLKLWHNLPLTIATTVAMSLIIKFWSKLLRLAKELLGLTEPPKEQLRPSLPEGEIAHLYALDKFRSGFKVELGWRGAIVDAGVVQRELQPGRYRRRVLTTMIARLGLGQNAQLILWRDKEFPVILYLSDLFASDHQPLQLDIHAIFKLQPAHLLRSALEEITQPPEEIAKRISMKIAIPARNWVASLEADEPYRNRGRLAEWSALAEGWIKSSMVGSAFELLRVTDFRLFSPDLDHLYQEFGGLARQNEAARTEIERNKVRGALRQAVLAGKLEEVRDQSLHEDAVRAIEQEKSLREKALKQELAQAELDELEGRLKVWKRKQDVLLQALDPAGAISQTSTEVAQRFTQNLRQSMLDAADSPFSAHEREQIIAVLQSCQAKAFRSEETLSAIARGVDIPWTVFDPLARLRGSHTLHFGDGWRFFDGDSLWQVRLTRIATRRHGFLWLLESPALASFEMRGTPDNRRFEQEVILKERFRLTVGPHEIPVEYSGGTASRISIRISGPSAG